MTLYVCIHVWMDVCVCVCVYMYMSICMHICIYIKSCNLNHQSKNDNMFNMLLNLQVTNN